MWPVCLSLQFAEKFAEYKEAARQAKGKSQNGKMELATSPSQVLTTKNTATAPS